MTDNITFTSSLLLAFLCTLGGCSKSPESPKAVHHHSLETVDQAPGAPGRKSTWAYSGKNGIGTSYEAYVDGHHSNDAPTGNVSKVWFSVTQGILTETMFGLIHEAQLKDLQLIVVGPDFVDVESIATDSKITYLHEDGEGRPLSLAYKITNTDHENRYVIEKSLFTQPDTQALFHRVVFTPREPGLRVFVQANPHMANTGEGDSAWVTDSAMLASEGEHFMALKASNGWQHPTAGFMGESDLIADLHDSQQDYQYLSASNGNVTLGAELKLNKGVDASTVDIVLGFGTSEAGALASAETALTRGYDESLKQYNGEGDYVGWEDYLAGLDGLPSLYNTATDNGRLANVSALVLKAQEDKTHSGALIASLSNPWGDTVPAHSSSTGYKAVWPRDFYQCAMAFLALGDTQTPLVAFEYLQQVQVTTATPGNKGVTGWFLQKTHVDGELEWIAVQLDQTAMPIMLGWKLWKQGVLSDEEISNWYTTMLKPAANFLVNGGETNLDWNNTSVIPPFTQQERWEEQEGYSPSSIAATIAGLVTAADIAKLAGDNNAAEKYLAAADSYEEQVEALTYTATGIYPKGTDSGQYYLRITRNDDPNDGGNILARNGRSEQNEKAILDAGFLELVRYGVRAPDNSTMTHSLQVLDDETLADDYRVKYSFKDKGRVFPGWRRYGQDGYGEDENTGAAYAESGEHTPGQRGRVWPFFTGERGHYQLAAGSDTAQLRNTYIAAMEYFANDGLMLPEQVWDGVGNPTRHNFQPGDGTNSATPLAWTHAEYVKLLRSVTDGQVWDFYPVVGERYR